MWWQQASGAPARRSPGGFTLIELAVSLSVLTLALVGIGGLARFTTRVSLLHGERLEAQQAARRAIDRIVEELRWAETVVADAMCAPVGLCDNRITVRIPPGNPYRQGQPYTVTFQHNPRQREVERRVGRGVNNLASMIQTVRFTHLNEHGMPAAGPIEVRRIHVRLIVAPRTTHAITLESGVVLRNVRTPTPGPTLTPAPAPEWRPAPRDPAFPVPTGTPPPVSPRGPPMPR